MYFSSQAKETIVSPTDTIILHLDRFDSWQQNNNITDLTGSARFYSETGLASVNVDLTMVNKL